MLDVAIVGLGPVGAVLGNLLGGAGLLVAIFERDQHIVPIPRAVAFDGEIMRVIQAIGLADTLQPLVRPSPGAQFIDPAGNVMLRRASADEDGPQGWRNFYNFHQPVMEQVLRDGLLRHPNVGVHVRHEVFAIDERGDHVSVRVEDMATGRLKAVDARFVVGCDGARSLVRRLIGSEMEDLGLHEPWLVADFVLKRELPALPPMATQYCHPVTPVTYVDVIGQRRRWEFKLSPGADLRDAAAPERVWAMAAPWITPDDADMTRAALYTFHSLIAQRWRRGRLMLAGDSAHQTPPFMGQGLCAGIRDAANLAWKLERILRHGAPPALLDTYGPERRAHARAFIQMAVQLGRMLSAENAAHMHELSAEVGGQGSALVYPTPKLGEGLHDTSPGAGVVAPQPRLADGRLLDDASRYRFALLGHQAVIDALPAALLVRLTALDVVIIGATGAAASWLETLGRTMVLLRPDRYVLASLEHAGALDGLVRTLVDQIGPACLNADQARQKKGLLF